MQRHAPRSKNAWPNYLPHPIREMYKSLKGVRGWSLMKKRIRLSLVAAVAAAAGVPRSRLFLCQGASAHSPRRRVESTHREFLS